MAYYFSISCAGTAVIAYVMQDILAREGFPYEGASFTNEMIRSHRSQGHPPTLHCFLFFGLFSQQRYLCIIYFGLDFATGFPAVGGFADLSAHIRGSLFHRSMELPLGRARGVAYLGCAHIAILP